MAVLFPVLKEWEYSRLQNTRDEKKERETTDKEGENKVKAMYCITGSA